MKKSTSPAETKKGCLILIALVALIIMGISFTCSNEPLTKEEKRSQMINDLLFNKGRESVNIKLINMVKNNLNDPNSMGNLEVTYIDKDSIIVVTQRFTAKNALGGTVRADVSVAIDTLGNIIKVIDWID